VARWWQGQGEGEGGKQGWDNDVGGGDALRGGGGDATSGTSRGGDGAA
jgi:hypothetical protein